jgi:hypothetical protein
MPFAFGNHLLKQTAATKKRNKTALWSTAKKADVQLTQIRFAPELPTCSMSSDFSQGHFWISSCLPSIRELACFAEIARGSVLIKLRMCRSLISVAERRESLCQGCI